MCCEGKKENAVFCVRRSGGGYYLSQYGDINSYHVRNVLQSSDL